MKKKTFRLIALVMLTALAVSCLDDDDTVMITEQPPEAMTDTITYLALGDSYTIGTAVDETERWPALLAEYLRTASGDPAQKLYETTPDIIAVNGWTTTDLKGGINRRMDLLPAYDLVSLLIGVNNQYRGGLASAYATEFEQLLNTAITKAGNEPKNVFVVSIPDYAFTPSGGGSATISEELDQFNSIARTITERYDVLFLNITPISREGFDDTELVATDNLHPSGKQYRRWVNEVIGRSVRELLEE